MVGGVNDSKLTWRSGGGVVEGKSAKWNGCMLKSAQTEKNWAMKVPNKLLDRIYPWTIYRYDERFHWGIRVWSTHLSSLLYPKQALLLSISESDKPFIISILSQFLGTLQAFVPWTGTFFQGIYQSRHISWSLPSSPPSLHLCFSFFSLRSMNLRRRVHPLCCRGSPSLRGWLPEGLVNIVASLCQGLPAWHCTDWFFAFLICSGCLWPQVSRRGQHEWALYVKGLGRFGSTFILRTGDCIGAGWGLSE